MTSPGSSVNTLDTYDTSVTTSWINRLVRLSCTVSPSSRVLSARSRWSSSVSIHGPSGQKVSNPLARDHCASLLCRSLAVTSLAQV